MLPGNIYLANTQRNIIAGEQSGLVRARLKWFNGPKGFGFVNPEDRDDVDAFLHITTLQNAGLQTIGEGACMLCEIEYGDKGAHVKQITEILDTGTLPDSHGAGNPVMNGDGAEQTREMNGVVKWYKEEQGFGFIVPEDNLKDVFIHKTCLDRHGVKTLEAGQKVYMTFRVVPKGREVISFSLIDKG